MFVIVIALIANLIPTAQRDVLADVNQIAPMAPEDWWAAERGHPERLQVDVELFDW